MITHGVLLNSRLIERLASAGHGDRIVIADAGLPVPAGVPLIDLSLVDGVPTFAATLEAVLATLVAESLTVAEELDPSSQPVLQAIPARLPVNKVSHASFKDATAGAHVFVRTGEMSPFANALVVAGVPFLT